MERRTKNHLLWYKHTQKRVCFLYLFKNKGGSYGKVLWWGGGTFCASRLLVWVPGHVDVDGNDCADELAKRVASVSEGIFSALWSYLGPEPCCGISQATVSHEINESSREKHRQRWTSTEQEAADRLNALTSLAG